MIHSRGMAIAPLDLYRIASDQADAERPYVRGDLRTQNRALPRMLVNTACARTLKAQIHVGNRVTRLVRPGDEHFGVAVFLDSSGLGLLHRDIS